MKLCCTDWLVPGDTYTQKAHSLRQWGYDGIAIYADYDGWNEEKRAEVLGLEAATGVRVAEFCFIGPKYGHLNDTDETAVQANVRVVLDAIELAGKLGAVTEVEFDGPRVSEIDFNHNRYPLPPPDMEDRFVAHMQSFCDTAAPTGTQVLLEACNRYEREYNNLQEQSARMVEKAQRPNAGLLCDVFHMAIDERDVAASLAACGPLVRHVHLGDTNRRLPGQGMMCWERIFAVLREIGYDGYLNLECSVFGNAETELRQTSGFLRSFA